jgi:malonyl-CoA O-methyltransferase
MAEWLTDLVKRHSTVLPHRASILEIGCGTGALTVMLRNAWPDAEITALDLAPAMLEAAKRRIDATVPAANYNDEPPSHRHKISFLQADAEEWSREAVSASFDLIVSSACFQWLARPEQTLLELKRLLRPGGMLAFTTFGAGTFHELHAAFEAAYLAQGLEPQRHGLPLRKAEEWHGMLAESGFYRPEYERRLKSERYPTVRDFLHSVQAVGASASEASASGGARQRRLFRDMFHHYETHDGGPDGVRATYELLLLHAFA